MSIKVVFKTVKIKPSYLVLASHTFPAPAVRAIALPKRLDRLTIVVWSPFGAVFSQPPGVTIQRIEHPFLYE
jgi:hypothetical protein